MSWPGPTSNGAAMATMRSRQGSRTCSPPCSGEQVERRGRRGRQRLRQEREARTASVAAAKSADPVPKPRAKPVGSTFQLASADAQIVPAPRPSQRDAPPAVKAEPKPQTPADIINARGFWDAYRAAEQAPGPGRRIVHARRSRRPTRSRPPASPKPSTRRWPTRRPPPRRSTAPISSPPARRSRRAAPARRATRCRPDDQYRRRQGPAGSGA